MSELVRVLTYDGSALDCALNYLALAVSLVPLLLLSLPPYAASALEHALWLCLLAGLFALQIVVALAGGELGVSLVWSAIVGYVLCAAVMRRDKHHFWFVFSAAIALMLAVSIWVYYAIEDKPMTTVAHVCALVLGIGIAVAVLRERQQKPSRDSLPLLADDPLRHMRQSSSAEYSPLGSETV